jgi:hypothetical protein
MHDFNNFAVAVSRHGRKILLGTLCSLALSACAHPVAPMQRDHTIAISGRDTAGYNTSDATQKTLNEAARLTLDHGFRYFQIVGSSNVYSGGPPSIRPGADMTIKVYATGEINPHSPGVWDAENIGAGSRSDDTSSSTQSAAVPSPSAAQPQTEKRNLNPHCTVYGCTW